MVFSGPSADLSGKEKQGLRTYDKDRYVWYGTAGCSRSTQQFLKTGKKYSPR